jgi:antitoxin component YwqK of YwqJK toxin-antitoxin module
MWKNGIREGIGVQFKADGNKLFEGMYESGKRSGNGIYYFSNNIYLEAVFENDFPTKEGRLINQSGAQPRELNYVQSNGEISSMKIPK